MPTPRRSPTRPPPPRSSARSGSRSHRRRSGPGSHAASARWAVHKIPPMPRISVVVPIYNVEPYLEECLESIAHQTYRDLEVVMVDDGSKDNSPAIAERFAARDERFRLVTQPNGGLGSARNTGIKEAGGELLA